MSVPAKQTNATVLAQRHTEEAIDTLVDVMRDGAPKERIQAANALLNRAHGTPYTTPAPLTGKAGAIAAQMANMSEEELLALAQAIRKPDAPAAPPAKLRVRATDVTDAEFTEKKPLDIGADYEDDLLA